MYLGKVLSYGLPQTRMLCSHLKDKDRVPLNWRR